MDKTNKAEYQELSENEVTSNKSKSKAMKSLIPKAIDLKYHASNDHEPKVNAVKSSKNNPGNSLTRQNIMDAFWKLYCKKRIQKITVKEVCAVAGYNRSTFYVYFKDVYEILEEIEYNTIKAEDFEKNVLTQALNSNTVTKKEMLRNLLNLFEVNITYLPVLLSENGDPQFRKRMLIKLEPIVLASFRQLSQTEKSKIAYIMEYQSSAMLNTISKWFNNGKDIPIEEFIELLIALTTNGIQKELLKYK